jgi:hypothetical protein
LQRLPSGIRIRGIDGDNYADLFELRYGAGFQPNVANINSPWLPVQAGDGLRGIVRLANGEISCWPKRGYGSFDPKIAPPGQAAAQGPQAAPVPRWLKNFLLRLRPGMRRTATVQIGGFEVDARELSLLAGVPVRKLL